MQLTIALLTALGMQSVDLSRNRMHFVNCLEAITKKYEEYRGSVVKLRLTGPWVEPQIRRCIVYLSRTLYPLLRTGSTQETY